MTRSAVVSVTGPPGAGVTTLVAELRRRMPSYRFVEPDPTAEGQRPAAVVFVVSAVAPVTESECALACLSAEHVSAVVAVVSKVDDHRAWRKVVAANRERFAVLAPGLAGLPWVAAAAAPRLGEPRMDELVALLERMLGDPTVAERHRERAAQSRLCRLRDARDELLGRRRMSAASRTAALRGQVQQARLTLTHTARRRCASLRAEMLADAAMVGRRDIPGFAERMRRRCDDVLADVDDDIAAAAWDTHAEVRAEFAPSHASGVTDPPLTPRRLETQLMTVLGAGFGLGVALVVTRLFAGLSPQLAAVGTVAGGVAGVVTAAWVVRARTLLHDRAVLQAWAGEMAAAVRAAAEERIAAEMLTAEAALAAAGAAAGAVEDTETTRRIAAIEAEIRELVRARQRSIRPG